MKRGPQRVDGEIGYWQSPDHNETRHEGRTLREALKRRERQQKSRGAYKRVSVADGHGR